MQVRGPRSAWLRTLHFPNARECDFARLASHNESRFSTKATYKTITSKLMAKKGVKMGYLVRWRLLRQVHDLAHELEYALAHETAAYADLFFSCISFHCGPKRWGRRFGSAERHF